MYKREEMAVVDIETNKAWDTIWMVGVYFPASGKSIACQTPEGLGGLLSYTKCVVGHNIVGFDLPILSKVWGFQWDGGVVDTLVLDRLLNPSVDGGHSLRACALRAGGELKDDFNPDDFDKGLTDDMITYCLQDCKATWDVLEDVTRSLDSKGFSQECRDLETRVAQLTQIQEKNGFAFDFPKAAVLHEDHKGRMASIEKELRAEFPPIIEERWSLKTGKRLKDKVTVFNIGSRQQVAERLAERGAVWKRKTPTGRPVVDEGSLMENSSLPEAAKVLEYMTLQKRLGMLKSWLDAVAEDDRIHGRVNTCGAITGRMTHSKPNMAQIPSDPVYRECFIAEAGCKLVGIDASGLELRMLAHYMGDAEYTDLILNGDIHTHNQEATGLETRRQAKKFIYAFL